MHARAQGNLILADANYEILTLLRSHRDDDKGLAFMARHAYPIHSIRLRAPLTRPQLAAALSAADEKQTLRGAACSHLACKNEAGLRSCVTRNGAEALSGHHARIMWPSCTHDVRSPKHDILISFLHQLCSWSVHRCREQRHLQAMQALMSPCWIALRRA